MGRYFPPLQHWFAPQEYLIVVVEAQEKHLGSVLSKRTCLPRLWHVFKQLLTSWKTS
jgi:hypothetical protein